MRLGLSQVQLFKLSEVSVATIRRAEKDSSKVSEIKKHQLVIGLNQKAVSILGEELTLEEVFPEGETRTI